MISDVPGRKVAFSHFGTSCIDLARMRTFYTEVMGMVVSDEGRIDVPGGGTVELCFLTTDPEDHHQFVLTSGRTDTTVDMSPYGGGVIGAQIFQMSFRLDSLASLRSMMDRFRAQGIEAFVGLNHGNAWAVYTRDIEGNPVELFVDSPWYVAQPCGFLIDFSKTDDEIVEETRAYCEAQPEVEPYSSWSARMAGRIAAAQAGI